MELCTCSVAFPAIQALFNFLLYATEAHFCNWTFGMAFFYLFMCGSCWGAPGPSTARALTSAGWNHQSIYALQVKQWWHADRICMVWCRHKCAACCGNKGKVVKGQDETVVKNADLHNAKQGGLISKALNRGASKENKENAWGAEEQRAFNAQVDCTFL